MIFSFFFLFILSLIETRTHFSLSKSSFNKLTTDKAISAPSLTPSPNNNDEDDDDTDVGLICGLVFGLLAFVALVALAVWLYSKWKSKQIRRDYTMNPESFLAHQNLSLMQQMRLQQWKINQDPQHKLKNFSIKPKKTVLGSVFELNFHQLNGVSSSIIGGVTIPTGVDNCYFEVEIEKLENPKTDIVIGFGSGTEFVNSMAPGEFSNSIGIHSQTGEVFINNSKVSEFKIRLHYGETLGIGLRSKDKRIWISYNGVFLNETAPSEKKLTDKEKEKKQKELSLLDPEVVKEIKKKEDDIEREAKKKKIVINFGKKDLYPVVSCNGPCILLLNIGGAPFRLFQKEIATGLL